MRWPRLARTLAPAATDQDAWERIVATTGRVRVLIAVTALATVDFMPGRARVRPAFVLGLGIVYLLWALLVPIVARRSTAQIMAPVMAGIDLVAVFVFQILLPATFVVALFGYLLIVAFYTALVGVAPGLVVAAMALLATLVAQVATPASWHIDSFTLVMYAVSLSCMTVLVDAGRREQRHARFFAISSDLLAVVGADGYIRDVNPAWEATLGWTPEELAAHTFVEFLHPDDRERTLAEARAIRAGDRPAESGVLEHRWRAKDGTYRWLAWQVVTASRSRVWYAAARDITEHKRAETQLAHQATHDPLTGLPNRTLFLDRLRVALARSQRRPQSVAVVFLDLDHFKVLNDSLGHSVGDRVLVTVANRLQAVVRPADTVARFGGDEFVVLCEELADEDTGMAIAERLLGALDEPVPLLHGETYLSGSVGVAFAPHAATDPAELLRDADAAMYAAKDRGRGRIERFTGEMRERVVFRMQTEADLRRAVERGELRLVYQPGINVRSGRAWGVEALIRWDHPQRGLVEPESFIGLAEETGLITQIGEWVLREACQQVSRWRRAGSRAGDLRMSVNLSTRQFAHPDLAGMVSSAAADAGIEPSQVSLEITETMLMQDAHFSAAVLEDMRRIGVSFGIDDFGTGYSSLAELKRFPVTFLKVDRSFVAGLGADTASGSGSEDAAILNAVVGMGRALGLHTVAEGVQTAEQLALLRTMGYDFAQGFYIAPPLPPEGVADLIERDVFKLPSTVVGAETR